LGGIGILNLKHSVVTEGARRTQLTSASWARYLTQ